MPHDQLILHVRQLIHEKFQQFGIESDTESHESILIRDGYYCGRRFISDSFQAIWFFEDNQIKYYDSDGSVAEVINILDASVASQSLVA